MWSTGGASARASLGGDIINTFTVTLKAIQEARKKLYQKHTLSGILPEALRSAAMAARAAARTTPRATPRPPEEEATETDNK
jgi:hypothetical protein